MQMKNLKDFVSEREGCFLQGTMHLFQPSAPTSASTGCQTRDLVIRVSGCGLLEF